jgi:uncharacterized protein (TIGR04552 family)
VSRRRRSFHDWTLAQLASIRHVLRGGSVVDWHRLYFDTRADVDHFLRLNEFDPDSAADMARLAALRTEAVEYLERHLGFRIADEVAEGIPAQDVFLVASLKGKRRAHACVVLKTMHAIHRMACRELIRRLPVTEDQLRHLVEDKVVRAMEEMQAAGCSIVEFEWGHGDTDGLITKLLAEREDAEGDVNENLRLRIITSTDEELFVVVREMIDRLVPFNCVVPGQSANDLLDFRKMVQNTPDLQQFLPSMVPPFAGPTDNRRPALDEFSGPTYRIVSFLVDMPVRIDRFFCRPPDDPLFAESGPVVFIPTEFQLVDIRTARGNEAGENGQERYRERQFIRVRTRLLHGIADSLTGASTKG